MKLPQPPKALDLAAKLAEFDVWITPSLDEIRDTDRFKAELRNVAAIFDALCETTGGFASIADCSPEAVTSALLKLVARREPRDASILLKGAASVLYLATGKSDNNAKCQLPLYLRDKAKWAGYPAVKRKKGELAVTKGPLPRILEADVYMQTVADLSGQAEEQQRLLREFVQFILSDEKYVSQLWSIGHSYNALKSFDNHLALLTPLVIFQVRGSVSASGGHEPEALLRRRFDEWGLRRGVDYNTSDVVIDLLSKKVKEVAKEQGLEKETRAKTRAYDFVLPYVTPGWRPRIFIQSQFYAGDSGSVSHKNVDQTSTSRASVLERHRGALFDEYVDGAGYFSSLNGDLKTLLSMSNTHSFFQVRSAPIRLRRALQEIGFLTPSEVEHAIARTDGSIEGVTAVLEQEGYRRSEIQRCLESCNVENCLSTSSTGALVIREERRELARRYLLLDTIACFGAVPNQVQGSPKAGGYLLVPGYGSLYGMKMVNVLLQASKLAPSFVRELADSTTVLRDLQRLEEQQWIMSS